MHDVAVALDDELLGDRHAAIGGDAADIVAAKVQQHEVLGDLFRIVEQALGAAGVAGKGFQGRNRLGIKRLGVREVSIAGRLGFAIENAKPAVRFKPDEGISPEAFATCNRLEQEAAGRFRAQLQHGGNRGFYVPDSPTDNQSGIAHWSDVIVAL